MIPALVSLRGNISSPYIARNSRDLIIGDFSKRTWVENTLATYVLSIIASIVIGILSILLSILLYKGLSLSIDKFFFIPLLTNLIELSLSIPLSTIFNYVIFKCGLNPNNIVNPIMTTVDDFLTIYLFYITLLILRVP